MQQTVPFRVLAWTMRGHSFPRASKSWVVPQIHIVRPRFLKFAQTRSSAEPFVPPRPFPAATAANSGNTFAGSHG